MPTTTPTPDPDNVNDPPEFSHNDVAAQDDADVTDDQTPQPVPGDAEPAGTAGTDDDQSDDDATVWPPEPTEPASE